MSEAATLPHPSTQPSPFAPLVSLVRKLIDYGKQLVASLKQPTPPTDLYPVAQGFGTYNIAHILARIICGLHRAAALDARLARLIAGAQEQPQQQPTPAALAMSRPPRDAAPASPRSPRTAIAPPAPLTPEQIADQVNRQPIGEVFVDICRDLGILPWHPLWRELFRAIVLHGGMLGRLCMHISNLPRLDPAAGQSLPLLAATGPP